MAETMTNPRSFIDLFYYISTCLTVSYANVFPVTQHSRLIASLVMTLGSALTNNVLVPPGREKPATARNQEAVLVRFDAFI